jgi:hypothetical protein
MSRGRGVRLVRCAGDSVTVRTPTQIRHLPPGWWLSGGARPQLEVPLRPHPTSCLTAPFFVCQDGATACPPSPLVRRERLRAALQVGQMPHRALKYRGTVTGTRRGEGAR